jgi:ligand-binding sensor domain-containing protein/signal transduction histidine kinase
MRAFRKSQAVLLALFVTLLGTILAPLPIVAGGPGRSAGPPPFVAAGGPYALQTPRTAHAISPSVAPETVCPTSQIARFETVSSADGLSFPIVNAILQDGQGFMWFGTENGLNRFDGHEFVVLKKDPGDPTALFSDAISSLYEDGEGVFWVGTAGGIEKLDRATGAMDHSHPLWGRGQIYTMYEDRSGVLWVGHRTGLFGYDLASREQLHRFRYDPRDPDNPRSVSNDHVRVIWEDQFGDLWVGTQGGLDRFDRTTETFSHYRNDPDDPASLSNDVVRAIYEDQEGALWIGTAGGLNRFDRGSETFIRYQHTPGDRCSLSDDTVTAILEDHTGMLWVGTANGLNRMDRALGLFSRFHHDPDDPNSLTDDVVLDLYEDRSGVLWIATLNGLSKFNRRASQFRYYREQPTEAGSAALQVPGLSSGKVTAVFEDSDGVLWIGTRRGLNKLDPESGRLSVYRHDPEDPSGLSHDTVNAIYQDGEGVLWIGTDSGWLQRFDAQTETFARHQQIVGQISAIAEDLSGKLWLGTWNDGLYELGPDRESSNHHTSHPDNPYGLNHRNIWSLHVDRTGTLWVGLYSRGIDTLEDVNYDRYPLFTHHSYDPHDANSLGHGRVLTMYQDPASDTNVVWVGTLGGGLTRVDLAGNSFTRYTQKDGLGDDSVGCILADSAGFLWLQTTKGLSRFDPRTETFQNYDQRDGVLSSGQGREVCLSSTTGELLFGGSDGLYAFHPEQIEDNPHIPPIVITELGVANEAIAQSRIDEGRIRLSHRENHLSFQFAALDYTHPERNLYAYKLEGLETEWVQAGTRRYVEYRNLRPGEYAFRVKGSNDDGLWNEEGVRVSITISPPFWETWWFRGLVALGLAGLLVGAYGLRVRSIQARSRRLEAQVEERTAELRREAEQRLRAEEALRQAETEKAVTAERGRLARELHDAVTQTLFSASLVAEALPNSWERDRQEGRQLLQDLRQLSRGALAEMRTLLLELRPAALVETSMEDLLRQLAEAAMGREGFPITVTVEGDCSLPPDVHVALYRITQEALHNVAKHARASRTTVSLVCARSPSPTNDESGSRTVTLSIGDDGRGFDPEQIPPERLGLGIMRERADAIGAELRIQSERECGTEITVVWSGE